jgi:hypothetical protein
MRLARHSREKSQGLGTHVLSHFDIKEMRKNQQKRARGHNIWAGKTQRGNWKSHEETGLWRKAWSHGWHPALLVDQLHEEETCRSSVILSRTVSVERVG